MIRTIVVGAAADSHRQAVCSVISQHQKVCCRLGRTVGAACVDRCLLCKEQIRAVQRQVAVHLIGGNLMIAGNAVFPAGVHQHSRTLDVGIQKNFRILNRAVHMAFRREVYYHIRMFLFEQTVHRLPVCDAVFYKTEIFLLHHGSQSGKITGIGQAVQTDNPVIRVFF